MGPDGTKIIILEKMLYAFRAWNDKKICAEVFYEFKIQSIQIPPGNLDVK